MRLRSFAACAVLLLTSSLIARADSFTFSFGTSSNTFYGSGSFDADFLSGKNYQITSIMGSVYTGRGVDPKTISKLSDFNGGDNLLVKTNAGDYKFDGFGLSFDLSNGGSVNIYSLGKEPVEVLMRSGGGEVPESASYSIVPAATPEPSGIALLGTGLLGVAGVARKRFLA